MKKLLSILCVFILLVTFIFPVSAANDGDEKTMTSTELSIKRISGQFTEKTENEIAKEVLRELGMPENLIEGVNEEYLDMVYNAKKISANDQYGKMNSEGKVTPLSYEEAMKEKDKRDGNEYEFSTVSIDPETNGEAYADSLFYKMLIVLETRNAPAGTVGVVCGFNWIDEPFYRCWDVVAISGTEIQFDVETTEFSLIYDEQIEDLYLSETTVVGIEEEYDFLTLENEGNILYAGNFVGVKFDMPMDVYTPLMLWMRNNIGVVFTVKATIPNPQLITNFTATGWYFHQKRGFETDVSLSGDGVSLSISPTKYYDDPHEIQVETTYAP